MIILGVLVGAVLLLGGVCGGWYLLHNSGNNAANSGSTPTANKTTSQPSPTLTGPLIDNKCDLAKGATFERVRDVLQGMGFKVQRQDVAGPRDKVVEVTPCQAPKGATITVKVGNGQAGGGTTPGASPSGDNGNPGPGGGGLPGPACSFGIGGGICQSGGPSPSGAG
jgi:hypothetical protein